MKSKLTLLLVAGCLGFFLARVYDQATAKAAPADSPTVVFDQATAKTAPADSSTVVFENDKVRCILYHSGSGKNVCGFGMHSHPAHLYIMKTAGKFRVTTPDGKEATEEAKAGDVGWEPALMHRYEAISPGIVEVYLVEVKDKDWKPSTGLSP